MVDGVGIVRMPLSDLSELLDRALIIHVVKVLEGSGVERVGVPERHLGLRKQTGTGQDGKKKSQDRKLLGQGRGLW